MKKFCLLIMLKWWVCPSISLASYTLSEWYQAGSCPFMQSDSFAVSMNRLHETIKNQLSTKVEDNRRCLAFMQSVSNEFSMIDQLFSQQNTSSQFERIQSEMLEKRITDLELDLITHPEGSPAHESLSSEIRELRTSLFSSQVNLKFALSSQEEAYRRENLTSAYQYLDNILVQMRSMDPECIGLIGGWEQVLPILMNTSSALSSINASIEGAIAGASMRVLSSFVALFQDINSKAAIRNINQNQNAKVISCSYFLMQQTTCEYQRGYRLSRDKDSILDIINQRFQNEDTKAWDQYFSFLDHIDLFDDVFNQVATLGTALTLDTSLIASYFSAKRSQPETIFRDLGRPPAQEEEGSEVDVSRQKWLTRVRNRGIRVVDRGPAGNILPLTLQVENALIVIDSLLSTISSVEEILASTRSFIDLKHELDSNPQTLLEAERITNFFENILANQIVSTNRLGLIHAALKIFKNLIAFLNLRYDDVLEEHNQQLLEANSEEAEPSPAPPSEQKPYDLYHQKVNLMGYALFESVAEGAIAQVDQQTVLGLGSVVQSRMRRVATLVQEEFLALEARSDQKKYSFSDYIIDRALRNSVAQNYTDFSGSGTVFRDLDAQTGKEALEKGFKKEILHILHRSLKEDKNSFLEKKNSTAAHLCSLYSGYLQRMVQGSFFKRNPFLYRKARKILEKCTSRYEKLELIGVLKKSDMDIDWENPCFYTNYQNLLETQKLVYRKKIELGGG